MKNQFLFDIFKAAELIKVYIYDVTPLKYEFKGIFKIYLVNTHSELQIKHYLFLKLLTLIISR